MPPNGDERLTLPNSVAGKFVVDKARYKKASVGPLMDVDIYAINCQNFY